MIICIPADQLTCRALDFLIAFVIKYGWGKKSLKSSRVYGGSVGLDHLRTTAYITYPQRRDVSHFKFCELFYYVF